ncbi:MAG: glycosyltransferase family A protein [Gemmataceae bacterium]
MTFSIIMPTYQRPHTLPRAIASVLAQTYPDWELIVVNNDTARVDVPEHQRIRVMQHTERASASYARNCGLAEAKGDVVCFADDDDIMLPDALEMFESQFRLHPNAKLVHGGIRWCSGELNFSFATPSCAVRRQFATPTWGDQNFTQDQIYWGNLMIANGWTVTAGDIVMLDRVVCVAFTDPRGGLRSGNL